MAIQDPKELFQTVCDELGAHFSATGAKYLKSGPKLRFVNDTLKLEVCFHSSRTNRAGESVSLEILPWFYSTELPKEKGANGILLGHRGIFHHREPGQHGKHRVRQIFGDFVERDIEEDSESTVADNNSCNIANLNAERFDDIVTFIDQKILLLMERLPDPDFLQLYIEEASKKRRSSWKSYSQFRDFVTLKRPDLLQHLG